MEEDDDRRTLQSFGAQHIGAMPCIGSIGEVALHRDALLRRDREERRVRLERLLNVAEDVLAPARPHFGEALLHVRRHVRHLREQLHARFFLKKAIVRSQESLAAASL